MATTLKVNVQQANLQQANLQQANLQQANSQNDMAVREDLLRVEGLTKIYDGTIKAVDNVSLTVMKGEIFGLLGGSGCGKSTLLRMLAGFEKPTKGKIYLAGQDITDIPAYQRPINMMFQSYALSRI